jgi:hypothetical protein
MKRSASDNPTGHYLTKRPDAGRKDVRVRRPTTISVNFISCRGAPIFLCAYARIRFPKDLARKLCRYINAY